MTSLTKAELGGEVSDSEPADEGKMPSAMAPEQSASLEAERRLSSWLQRELWRRDSRLARLRMETAELQLQLEALQSSTSWRVTSPLRTLAVYVRRLGASGRRGLRPIFSVTLRLPRELRRRRAGLDATRDVDRLESEESYEQWLEAYDTLTDVDLERMDELAQSLEYRPLVSVVMPVYNTAGRFLRRAIDSTLAQRYGNWELCIADDASTAPHVQAILRSYERRDPRIRVVRRSETGGISAATNSALELAHGELIAFLDHDDELRPHSLLLAVQAFAQGEHVAWVYSDEDKIDTCGRRSGPYFKPDWNPALLLGQNYLCHLSVVRADLVRKAAGLRSEFDGSQDWDLALRITEALPPEAIVHVPHVLYHWRAIPESAASGPAAKPYAIDAARRATVEHLSRMGRPGYVAPVNSHQSVHLLLPQHPLVSVIVPSTGNPSLLGPCISDLLHATDYPQLEVLVALREDAFSGPDAPLLDYLEQDERVSMVSVQASRFNFAKTINRAAARANGEFLLLFNDDVRVLDDGWLESMVGYGLLDGVGAVGARLLYPDRTIQHAGMLVGGSSIAQHLYNGRGAQTSGYLNRARLLQDVTVVAAACMLVRNEAFLELRGLDETFPVAYNDVDFCLRLRQAGWRVLYAPDATLVHEESASVGSYQQGREEEHRADAARLRERWGVLLEDDPMHNPNLAFDATNPSRLAFPPRARYPWRSSSRSSARSGPSE